MRWLLILLCAVLAALIVGIALLPLSLALAVANAPVEGDPDGTVWNGRIENARVQGLTLGTLGIRLHALPLLSGAVRGDVTAGGPLGTGGARLSREGDTTVVTKLDASVELSALAFRDAFGQPLTGTAALRSEELVLSDGGCRSGELTVSTDLLRAAARAYGGTGFDLDGTGQCRDGVLTLPLSGSGADGEGSAYLRLSPGRYVTELTLRPTDPAVGHALTAYGFTRGQGGYTLVTRGSF
ncbi:type II secretion system protein N [Parvularcula dongshanensis]|uniref:Type II secretion system protein N n=1 Tax=Parvularcula dongshanensis TaxID=1173995 RepID=A0A840HZT7_9PROT|nr:type II secretion system protein N [Parvularcula dongshanensis]MBB4657615.1 hypothetical protein [Parvularcula dongshanensis]